MKRKRQTQNVGPSVTTNTKINDRTKCSMQNVDRVGHEIVLLDQSIALPDLAVAEFDWGGSLAIRDTTNWNVIASLHTSFENDGQPIIIENTQPYDVHLATGKVVIAFYDGLKMWDLRTGTFCCSQVENGDAESDSVRSDKNNQIESEKDVGKEDLGDDDDNDEDDGDECEDEKENEDEDEDEHEEENEDEDDSDEAPLDELDTVKFNTRGDMIVGCFRADEFSNIGVLNWFTVWDSATLNPLLNAMPSRDCSWLGPILFSCDDLHLVSLDADGTLFIWNSETGVEERRFTEYCDQDGYGSDRPDAVIVHSSENIIAFNSELGSAVVDILSLEVKTVVSHGRILCFGTVPTEAGVNTTIVVTKQAKHREYVIELWDIATKLQIMAVESIYAFGRGAFAHERCKLFLDVEESSSNRFTIQLDPHSGAVEKKIDIVLSVKMDGYYSTPAQHVLL